MSAASLLYSAAQVRALDAHAIAQGTSGYTLMKRAGEAALRALRSRWPKALEIAVVAGGGNNGGDGYVVARFAQAAGLSATVLAVTPPDQLSGDARTACQDFRSSGGQVVAWSPLLLARADVIVDALLGTGLTSTVRAPIAEAIQAINACARPVFSLDLPSGLNADSGALMAAAVRADCTITFVALKTGLFLGDGPEHAGRLLFDDLEVTPPAEPRFTALLERLGEGEIARALPSRRRQANKGDFGRVLIVGGGVGMAGAVRLAGEACLRVGAGLVTVACARENPAAVVVGRPELIVHAVDRPDELPGLLGSADVVAIGPGLGRSDWAQALLERTLACGKRLVIDADALNLLAERRQIAPPGSVLTPHPGEAARLLEISTAAVQADRMSALGALSLRHPGAVIVLKGAGTLIGMTAASGPSPMPAICERGNPGMAAAGMGDVLTGAIAGILGQCRDPWLAARAGVMAHALAGDDLARERERGILALELADALNRWVNLRR
ncbi:MAG TPA: NAD(P)H-hydrate dehydratase [Steroidobacteraceae bacterium]|nr:NAD(P)H-hydrate dehydratase [Steroidobacteraceae bacterium]